MKSSFALRFLTKTLLPTSARGGQLVALVRESWHAPTNSDLSSDHPPVAKGTSSAKSTLSFNSDHSFSLLEHWNKNEEVNECAMIAQPGYAMRLTW